MFKRFLMSVMPLLLLSGCWFGNTPGYDEFTTVFSGERTMLFDGDEKWDFEKFLRQELKDHPEMECIDLLKFCYQAAFGTDTESGRSKKDFFYEFNRIMPDDNLDLIRVTSPDTARVNLAAWKAAGLPPEWLFRMTVMDPDFSDGKEKLQEYIQIAARIIPERKMNFSAAEFQEFAGKFPVDQLKNIAHGTNYLTPAYRLIHSRNFNAIPVLKKAAALPGSKAGIIAIDGRAASGKTTLAGQLKIILNAQIIHMDDFFLPPEMRTAVRLEEAGGNVHYERFKEEVLTSLTENKAFSYRIFDCKKNRFNGSRMIWKSQWTIVEGAYSTHPKFGKYADLTVFYDISPEEQMRRIYERNGAKAAKTFQNKWIPLEENYIRSFNIKNKADLILQ